MEELTPSLITERSISRAAALVEPVWYSHLFEIPQGLCAYKEIWENRLNLRTIGDMISEQGEPWTDEQVRSQIIRDAGRRYTKERGGAEFISIPGRSSRVGIHTLIANYKEIYKQVPLFLIRAAASNKTEIEGVRARRI